MKEQFFVSEMKIKIVIEKQNMKQSNLPPTKTQIGDPIAKPSLATTKMMGTLIICRWEVHKIVKNEK